MVQDAHISRGQPLDSHSPGCHREPFGGGHRWILDGGDTAPDIRLLLIDDSRVLLYKSFYLNE